MRATSAPVPAAGPPVRPPAAGPPPPLGLVRPRTAGEILDDAWGLYLADAPLLLALSGLFTVPAAVALLLLLTRPAPASVPGQLLLPAVAAVLLPLTGLGSGACQELFRRRAEGRPAGLGACLAAALRRGLDHVTARALVLALGLLGLPLLVMPGLAIWAGLTTLHPLLAGGSGRLFPAVSEAAQEGAHHGGKALAVTLCWLPLLVLVVVNLAALTDLLLWVADNLAGVQTAMVAVLLSIDNPAYLLALALLAWVVLTPFAEASNFLLHADARARHEGLDLWYRVQRLFPVRALGVLAAAALLGLAGAAPAQPGDGSRLAPPATAERAQVLRQVRQRVEAIRQEAEQANPYPGAGRWLPQLRSLARRLDPAGSASKGPYRWFYQGVDGFAVARDRDAALRVLTGLAERLEMAEAGLEQLHQQKGPVLPKKEIKALLPPEDDTEGGKARPPEETKAPEKERPQEQPAEGPDERGGIVPEGEGPSLTVPAGLGRLGGYVLIGLLLAVVAFAGLLLVQHLRDRPAAPAAESGKTEPSLESLLSRPEPQTAAALWRQAEDLARAGNHREAVRLLYAAVLALLHRANLIRYEPTRTNGEYLAQVEGSPSGGEEVREPFRRLTGLFELNWYGERACSAEDYRACHRLAEEIRSGV